MSTTTIMKATAVMAALTFLGASASGLITWVQSERKTYEAVEIIDVKPRPKAQPAARPTEVLGETFDRDAEPAPAPAPAAPSGTQQEVAVVAAPALATETTTAPTPTPTPKPTSTTSPRLAPVQPAAPSKVTLSGTFVVEAFFSPEAQQTGPANEDCSLWRGAYNVRVGDSTATIDSGRYESSSELSGAVVTRCTFTYTASVAQAASYTVAAVQNVDGASADSATIAHAAAIGGNVPTLLVKHRFCPEC